MYTFIVLLNKGSKKMVYILNRHYQIESVFQLMNILKKYIMINYILIR